MTGFVVGWSVGALMVLLLWGWDAHYNRKLIKLWEERYHNALEGWDDTLNTLGRCLDLVTETKRDMMLVEYLVSNGYADLSVTHNRDFALFSGLVRWAEDNDVYYDWENETFTDKHNEEIDIYSFWYETVKENGGLGNADQAFN